MPAARINPASRSSVDSLPADRIRAITAERLALVKTSGMIDSGERPNFDFGSSPKLDLERKKLIEKLGSGQSPRVPVVAHMSVGFL